MFRRVFYPRLAMSNLLRNRRTYLPYLLACVVSIFTFYTMLSIKNNGALNGIRGESVVESFTTIGLVILAIFCSVLLFYTNSFLVKRRKKELGLYSILGMEKRNIAILMFFETVFVAIAALVVGIGSGALFSQLIFWVLLRMMRYPVMMEMAFNPSSIGITAAFFGLLFLLAFATNLLQVHLASPTTLMAGANQGEKEPKASWLLTVVGLLCLGSGYFIALYYTAPLETLGSFFIAVGLVIVGTYCLFTSGSIALLKLMRKNNKFYYKPEHFISVSGMIYRMKQNAAGLATICILSCMVLVTVTSTVFLNIGAEDSIETGFPSDYELIFDAPEDADILLAGAMDAAQKSAVTLTNIRDFHSVSMVTFEENEGFESNGTQQDSFSHLTFFSLQSLEEYNRNEGTSRKLEQDEALIFITGGQYKEDSLTLNGISYRLHPIEQLGKEKSVTFGIGRSIVLVLADNKSIDEQLAIAGLTAQPRRTLSFDIEAEDEPHQKFATAYDKFVGGLSTEGYFEYRVQEVMRNEWYASNGVFLFLGLYLGILFMLAAALIIYYKQLSEGYDDAKRFEILQKVGMGEAEVKKTINRQILIVFFLPLLVAILHVTVAFFPISRVMVIFGIMNIPLLLATGLATILAYALVYLLVFRRTARTYFAIVRRQSASA